MKDQPISVDVYGFGDHDRFSTVAKNEKLSINFKGPAANTKDLYWRYNGFIMPSKFEGFGLAAYEAMASGIPVFLSNIPAFKSLIQHNAIYFNLNDSLQAAQILKEAMNGKYDLKAMVLDAQKYTEKTVKREMYVTRLIEIYKHLLLKK